MVSDETYFELASNSDLFRSQWMKTGRVNSQIACTSELKPPMFSSTAASENQTAAPTGATYQPKKADDMWGPFHGNKNNQRTIMQWFSTFSQHFYSGLPNPKPLLVLMGPPGSGKTFCIDWMITAFNVAIHTIDPLDYKQNPQLAAPRKRKRTTTRATKASAKKTMAEDDDEAEEDGGLAPTERELEVRTLKRLSDEAGQDGETLRQVLLTNTISQPKLIHIQDIQLCKPEFLRYLMALTKIAAKTPRANGIVIEMNADEAYGRAQQLALSAQTFNTTSGGGGSSSSTSSSSTSFGKMLQRDPACLFVKVFTAKAHEAREHLCFHRRRLQIEPLPKPRDDSDLLHKIALEAHGDFRQLEILFEWGCLAKLYAPPPAPQALAPSALAMIKPIRRLSPPRQQRLPPTAASAKQEDDDQSEEMIKMIQSDIDVGLLLVKSTMSSAVKFGYLFAEAVARQLRSSPLLQVVEFLRSFLCLGLKAEYSPKELAACSPDVLVQLMLRGIQTSAAAAARREGSFSSYKHVRQLPAKECCDIFGSARTMALHTCALRESILDQVHEKKESGSNTSSSSSTNKPLVEKKKAAALVTTDSHGYLDFDKLVPRRKRKPAEAAAHILADVPLARSTKITKSNSNKSNSNNRSSQKKAAPQATKKSANTLDQNGIKLLQALADMSTALSDCDIHPYIPNGEAHYICRAQLAASTMAQVMAKEPVPDWTTISNWIHPKRYDFTGLRRNHGGLCATNTSSQMTTVAGEDDDAVQ